MQVTFLGTGTSHGIPVIGCKCPVCVSTDPRDKRLRVSIHIVVEDKSLVIDCGPDFRQQMLRENICHLDAILFTHEHKDHTAGLDDIRAFNFMLKKAIPIYATSQVVDQLKKAYAYIFAEHQYPGIPEVEIFRIRNEKFSIENIEIIPIEVLHHKLSVLGFRIKNFTYITDASSISAEEKEKIMGTKVLVLNALQHEEHISHFNLKGAIAIIEEIKPDQAYLVHMNHRMGSHQEEGKKLPKNVYFSYDGLKIKI